MVIDPSLGSRANKCVCAVGLKNPYTLYQTYLFLILFSLNVLVNVRKPFLMATDNSLQILKIGAELPSIVDINHTPWHDTYTYNLHQV